MTLLSAFAESRNIPALKLADRVGIHKVIDVAHRFGVTSNIPAYLPIAIGAVEITLAEQVASYSVFPNDGLRVKPRLIKKVSNADGITLWEEPPAVDDVISQQTARSMMTLLQAVTHYGTGAAAAQLKHPLGGKTGTTSDFTDAWFLGFSPSVTCGVWVGFDSRESLGEKETGARAALPIWMTLMRAAIAGKDDEKFLADEPDDQSLKAEAGPLAKPGAPAQAGTAGVAARPASLPPAAGSSAKPRTGLASSVSVTSPPSQLAAKPSEAPANGAKPLVKPALAVQPAPARPAGAVKPALGSSPNPANPTNIR
jgi:penicillin-binding protein 1A